MEKRKQRSIYLFVSSLMIALSSFFFAFAKNAEKMSKRIYHTVMDTTDLLPGNLSVLSSAYDSLHLDISGLSRRAFEMAESGLQKLREQGSILNDSIISIIDFSLPSSEKRLYILDIKNYQVLYRTYVAHGRNSGRETANSFSNKPQSFKSSLGFYRTLGTYFGSNGFSLKLEGLEKGINDNAYKRAIVMHGADYVNPAWIGARGFIGRSEGCPAVMSNEAGSIINTIKNGTLLFIYHPDKAYRLHSSLAG